MNRPTCETCPFWQQLEPNDGLADGAGLCRVHAPSHSQSPVRWPMSNKNDWCGEHPQFADFKFQWRQAEIAKLDEQAKSQACPEIVVFADGRLWRCTLEAGHGGQHDLHEITEQAKKERCEATRGPGERCSRLSGHSGYHQWPDVTQ